MPISEFQFNPSTGWLDAATFPTTPANETETRNKLQLLHTQTRDEINTLITLLNSVTDGSSGADSVAMTPITDTGANATVQSIVEALITKLKAITDNASGADFVGATGIAGLTGASVQALLESLKIYVDSINSTQDTALATHKTSVDHDTRYYTETELNAGQLDDRYYTESEISASIGAGLMGATPPSGLTGSTVQALINSLKAAIDQTALGQIPDRSLPAIKIALGAITAAELAFDPATQAELDAHLVESAQYKLNLANTMAMGGMI